MTTQIEAVVFDFGGVMAIFHRPELFEALEGQLGLETGSLPEILYRSPEWRLAEIGAIDDAEYWRRIGPRLGLGSGTEPTEAEIRDFQQALFGEVEADPDMVDLVQRLRGRYQTGLLSNATLRDPQRLLERYGLEGLFDVVVVSAAVGLAKPDPAIYRLALEHLGTAPERTVFVDDFERNVVAASDLGMHGVHFTGYSDLIVALRELGLEPLEE